jgi:hypothetical protein
MTMTINGTSGLTFNDASTQATAATGFGFKNRLINGQMVVDQRNAGASVTFARGVGSYTTDRWNFFNGGTNNGNVTVQQDGVSSPTGFGFINSLKITNVTGGTAAAGDNLSLYQAIEGVNISDLSWGTSSAKPVTISFYVLCSSTGTFGVSARNAAADRSYVASFTVTTANTWQYVSVTIPGDTSGTWLSTNGVGIYLAFALGVGSTFQTTAGSWQAGNFFAVTGQVNLCTVSGAVFQVTGVQLEKGSTATSFDYRPYGTELSLCQRYYEKSYNTDVVLGTSTQVGMFQTSNSGGTTGYGSSILFKVTKRATPTMVGITYTGTSGSWHYGVFGISEGTQTVSFGNTGATTTGPYMISIPSSQNAMYGHWTASAEL